METGELAGLAPETVRYVFRFRGTAGEYFRIWIVNLFLTVITLGVYAAWAKVRTRRYIWANIDLAGHPFTFHGKPAAILRGNVIIAVLFTAYIAMERFDPAFAGVLFVVFTFVFPFLVCKSLRFNAHNTSYRNIRFHFQGSLRESYETYLLFAGIVPFTLFIFFPAWQFYKKRFFFNNLAYGTTESSFDGRKGSFYKAYLLATVLGVAVFIAFSSIAAFGAHRFAAASSAEWGPLKIIFPFSSHTSSEPPSFIPPGTRLLRNDEPLLGKDAAGRGPVREHPCGPETPFHTDHQHGGHIVLAGASHSLGEDTPHPVHYREPRRGHHAWTRRFRRP
jgi:hypothetical protein